MTFIEGETRTQNRQERTPKLNTALKVDNSIKRLERLTDIAGIGIKLEGETRGLKNKNAGGFKSPEIVRAINEEEAILGDILEVYTNPKDTEGKRRIIEITAPFRGIDDNIHGISESKRGKDSISLGTRNKLIQTLPQIAEADDIKLFHSILPGLNNQSVNEVVKSYKDIEVIEEASKQMIIIKLLAGYNKLKVKSINQTVNKF